MSSEETAQNGRRAELEALNAVEAVGNLLTESAFDLDRLLEEIVRTTAQSLGAYGCTIRLLDPTTDEMVLRTGYGLSDAYLTKGPVFASQSFLREVLQCGKGGDVILISDVSRDSRVQYPEEALEEGIRSVMSTALVLQGEVIGAMSVYLTEPHDFTDDEVKAFKALGTHAAAAIHLARLHLERLTYQRMSQELNIATRIQGNLMPEKDPELPGFDIAGLTNACGEVGGDFYDYITLGNDNLGLVVGDASGKGVPAALLMASARTALRVQAENVYAMSEVIARVNRALVRDTREEAFVTLFYGVLDAEKRLLTYVNAGHDFPFVFRDGKILRLESGGLPIGMFEASQYKERTIQLQKGDAVIIFTDGFQDVQNEWQELFGEERLKKVLLENVGRSAGEILQAMEQAIAEFTRVGEADRDDRTAIVIIVQ